MPIKALFRIRPESIHDSASDESKVHGRPGCLVIRTGTTRKGEINQRMRPKRVQQKVGQAQYYADQPADACEPVTSVLKVLVVTWTTKKRPTVKTLKMTSTNMQGIVASNGSLVVAFWITGRMRVLPITVLILAP